MVNTGNTRRESTQAYLIPLLAQAGFNVVADNCEALPCVFQQRLPALDYDLTQYISTAPPDPAYLTNSFTCDQIPSPENNNQGQNSSGWCNEEASAALEEADVTVDEAARIELIHSALTAMAEDDVMLPLFQFPKSGAYRTDRVGGPVEDELNNYRAFNNTAAWEDVDGDGTIVIGAEQYPGCLNPVNECANSSWYVWVGETPLLPGLWRTTNDQGYEITDLVAAEPVVEVL
jgi:ABC-type transport system substrate-binding protein